MIWSLADERFQKNLPADPRTTLPDMAKYDRLLTPEKDTGTTKKKGTST
ncbi:hypothetical protein [Streptomyces atratus]